MMELKEKPFIYNWQKWENQIIPEKKMLVSLAKIDILSAEQRSVRNAMLLRVFK